MEEVVSLQKRRRTSNAEAARTSIACKACRDRKVKCSGLRPCRYCLKKNLDCVYPDHTRKKLYSAEYVEDLKTKAAMLKAIEEQRTDTEPDSDLPLQISQDPPDPGGLPTPLPLDTGYSELNASTRSSSSEGRLYESNASAIVPDSVTSSSLHFGSSIRSLGSKPDDPRRSPPLRTEQYTPDLDDIYRLETGGVVPPSCPPALVIPSEDEAHSLLDAILESVGKLQHLVEPRAISDRLSAAYSTDPPCFDTQSIFYVEILMVFALGQLLQGKLPTETLLPGTTFFLEAKRLLPDFFVLRKSGIVAVEIMGLMAMYLQCADRREDAYLYAGMGLRLAQLNGMAQGKSSGSNFRSERAHRNRLWWSIYMKERRLAAAMGQPLSLHDDAITIGLPAESPGFFPTAPLKTNIQLARIIGSIMETVYGRKNTSIRSYIHHVKEVLGNLLEVARTLPVDYIVDFSQEFSITRVGATLYNMLYQGIMLATRPVLLYLTNLNLTNQVHGRATPDLGPFKKLAEACVEAAARSLQILQALVKQQLIAHFGFFDLDTTFSAAFVIALFTTLPHGTLKAPRNVGLSHAFNIFKCLEQYGNKAAIKRRHELDRICQHLGVEFLNFDSAGPILSALSGTQESVETESPNLFDWSGSADHFINDLSTIPINEDMLQNSQIDNMTTEFLDNWNDIFLGGVVGEELRDLERQLYP